MPTFKIKYSEIQERQWILDVQAETLEEAEELFETNNEDPWRMVDFKKADWAWDSGAEGDATDTFETNWEAWETA
jgi:hypothetical protein